MTIKFLTLCTFSVQHGFYTAGCRDVDFIVLKDTSQLLRNSRMLAKAVDGSLNILFEANDANQPVISVKGKVIRFGLKLNNPYFSNITSLPADSSGIQLIQNLVSPTALDPEVKYPLTGSIFSHKITKTNRPCTITLKDQKGNILQSDTIKSTENRDSVSYDITGQESGRYTIHEAYSGSSKTVNCYVDPELAASGAYAVIEILIGDSIYSSHPQFQVQFNARTETLKYYIVAGNYSNTEFGHLLVSDNGSTEDSRPKITFKKVNSSSFTATDIPASFLATDPTKKVVLFKSESLVARQEKARRKIQLTKNGDVLIPHLPQPSADKSKSDIIIQISKP
jgi:hypothetical protein